MKRTLALAPAAAACVVTPGGRAAQSPQGAGRSDGKVSPELRGFVGRTKAETVAVVVQLSAPPTGRLNALLQRGAHVERHPPERQHHRLAVHPGRRRRHRLHEVTTGNEDKADEKRT